MMGGQSFITVPCFGLRFIPLLCRCLGSIGSSMVRYYEKTVESPGRSIQKAFCVLLPVCCHRRCSAAAVPGCGNGEKPWMWKSPGRVFPRRRKRQEAGKGLCPGRTGRGAGREHETGNRGHPQERAAGRKSDRSCRRSGSRLLKHGAGSGSGRQSRENGIRHHGRCGKLSGQWTKQRKRNTCGPEAAKHFRETCRSRGKKMSLRRRAEAELLSEFSGEKPAAPPGVSGSGTAEMRSRKKKFGKSMPGVRICDTPHHGHPPLQAAVTAPCERLVLNIFTSLLLTGFYRVFIIKRVCYILSALLLSPEGLDAQGGADLIWFFRLAS